MKYGELAGHDQDQNRTFRFRAVTDDRNFHGLTVASSPFEFRNLLRAGETMNDSPTANRDHDRKNIVSRAMLVWFILIAAEIVHGILRAIFLVPLVGEFRSNQIGVFSGSVIILVVAYLTIHWIGATRRRELLFAGAIWLLATVAFEVGFGRFVMGLSWERITADYNLLEGGLMPLGLTILFFSPMIASKLQTAGK